MYDFQPVALTALSKTKQGLLNREKIRFFKHTQRSTDQQDAAIASEIGTECDMHCIAACDVHCVVWGSQAVSVP